MELLRKITKQLGQREKLPLRVVILISVLADTLESSIIQVQMKTYNDMPNDKI